MKKLPCLLLAPLAFAMAGGDAAATGGGGDSTYFEYRYHPDFPLDDFASGRLGILKRSFQPRYLAAAYRILKDKPLDQATRNEVTRMWLHSFIEFYEPREAADAPISAWIAARKAIPGVGERPAPKANDFSDDTLHVCLGDAYANAARTLKDRVQRFGAEGEPVKGWVRAQDLVFATCEKAQPAPPLPDDNVPPGPPIVRADREYQIAAAHFYRGDWDIASAAFLKIAEDKASPWQSLGLYLSARALLRKGTAPEKPDLAPLLEAQERLTRITADPKLSAMHDRARQLLHFAQFRTDPKALCGALASSVVTDKGALLASELFDLDLALGRVDAKECADAASGDGADLLDWMTTLGQGGDVANRSRWRNDTVCKQHAVDRWKDTQAMPWLVAAVMLAEATDGDVGALLDAARKVKPDSPAGLTLAYHRARLLLDQKREPAARSLLDERLADPALKKGMTALNLFRAQRLRLARDRHEFLSLAARWPNGSGYDDAAQEFSPTVAGPAITGSALLDEDAAPLFFDVLPLAESISAARDPVLPDEIRKPLLQIAFTRAVLLDEEKLALSLVEPIAIAEPKLATALRAYAGGKDAGERRFLAAQAFIDTAVDVAMFPRGQAPDSGAPPTDETTVKPRFITKDETARAEAEKKRFTDAGPVARWAADQLAAWARAHKDQPRMDELLHLAVEATRHAHDERTGPASKRAYKALHDLYPQSPWTKKTKYWY